MIALLALVLAVMLGFGILLAVNLSLSNQQVGTKVGQVVKSLLSASTELRSLAAMFATAVLSATIVSVAAATSSHAIALSFVGNYLVVSLGSAAIYCLALIGVFVIRVLPIRGASAYGLLMIAGISLAFVGAEGLLALSFFGSDAASHSKDKLVIGFLAAFVTVMGIMLFIGILGPLILRVNWGDPSPETMMSRHGISLRKGPEYMSSKSIAGRVLLLLAPGLVAVALQFARVDSRIDVGMSALLGLTALVMFIPSWIKHMVGNHDLANWSVLNYRRRRELRGLIQICIWLTAAVLAIAALAAVSRQSDEAMMTVLSIAVLTSISLSLVFQGPMKTANTRKDRRTLIRIGGYLAAPILAFGVLAIGAGMKWGILLALITGTATILPTAYYAKGMLERSGGGPVAAVHFLKKPRQSFLMLLSRKPPPDPPRPDTPASTIAMLRTITSWFPQEEADKHLASAEIEILLTHGYLKRVLKTVTPDGPLTACWELTAKAHAALDDLSQ